MANTYSQIYIQIVFAVKHRRFLISFDWEDQLYKYITGIVQNKGQKMIAINGMPDHIHIFLGIQPTCCISDLVREIKKSSTLFIKEQNLTSGQFNWQEGFGAFSYSHSQINLVAKYIMDQKVHHQKASFQSEYMDLLSKFNIEFKKEYLFEWLESSPN